MKFFQAVVLSFVLFFSSKSPVSCSARRYHLKDPELVAITVATEETDGYRRYVRSLKQYDWKFEVIGMGEEWTCPETKPSEVCSFKLNTLIKGLEKFKNDEKQLIIYTDSSDVIMAQTPQQVVEKFKKFNAKILFGADAFCWPDSNLEHRQIVYPKVGTGEKRFLNSEGFIGYAKDVYELLTSLPFKNDQEGQLYMSRFFLNDHKRLDTRSEIFQNLNNSLNDVALMADDDEYYLFNHVTQTRPSVIHGNGPSKVDINRFGNYLAKAYHPKNGCIICHEDRISLESTQSCSGDKSHCSEQKTNHWTEFINWPNVTMAIFIEQPTPFLQEFFTKIRSLNYPKSKISVLVHNNVEYHQKVVDEFFAHPENKYHSIKFIAAKDDSSEEFNSETREECVKNNCQFYFSVDSTVHFENENTLKVLIEQNRGVISPMMVRYYTYWSNVWASVDENGFYNRSDDYYDIIGRRVTNVWNMALVKEVVLIKNHLLKYARYESPYLEPDMEFATNLRDSGVFMFSTNMEHFGHLIDPESFDPTKIRPEFYQVQSNFYDWSIRYIHPKYHEFVARKTALLQPCPDVFWFPVVTDEFCTDLIALVEGHGKWSGGNDNNIDPRVAGGYENVPTVDIHMTQIGFQSEWLFFLKSIIKPIQEIAFNGHHKEPWADLNFVVRYRPGEQDHLRPHNDASTYTLNIALNTPQVDFQGGGCRFVRYNCSVLETRKGWGMIHPGRLTHYHEGLKVTNGTRYIMVSFIDP